MHHIPYMSILTIWSIYSSFHFITYKENHVFHNFFRVNYSICAYIVRFMLFFIHMILLYVCSHVTVCVTNDWLKQSLPTPAMHDDFYHKPYWQSPKDCGVPSLKILKYVTKSWGKIRLVLTYSCHYFCIFRQYDITTWNIDFWVFYVRVWTS